MMKQLTPVLLVGDLSACVTGTDPTLAVVHACKYPCHHRVTSVGERRDFVLHRLSPYYLAKQFGASHLYLNIVDPDVPLFYPETFRIFLEFAEKAAQYRNRLLIHCNQGRSRAPSLALLLLAKRGEIASGSYDEAAEAFRRMYPSYAPGKGIAEFLRQNWERL